MNRLEKAAVFALCGAVGLLTYALLVQAVTK